MRKTHLFYSIGGLLILLLNLHFVTSLRCANYNCAEHAECINDFCTCPKGYYGDGYHGCYVDGRCGCYSHGDPKLVSFDKGVYDLPVPCMYLMSRFQGTTCDWNIMLEADHRNGVIDNSSVWIKRVVWTINAESGEVDRNGISFDISGSLQKMEIPFDSADISLRKVGKFFVIKSSVCDIDFRFDGKLTASLDVPGTLDVNSFNGLCGDCNGSQDETKTVVVINETITSRTDKLFAFANILPEESGSVCSGAIEVYETCTPDHLRAGFGKTLCGGIFDPDGYFTECRKTQVNRNLAATFFFLCLQDYCKSGEAAACDDLSALATNCGVSTDLLNC